LRLRRSRGTTSPRFAPEEHPALLAEAEEFLSGIEAARPDAKAAVEEVTTMVRALEKP